MAGREKCYLMGSVCSLYIIHSACWALALGFALSSALPVLPMSTHPPSFRPGTGSNSKLSHSSSQPSALHVPPRNVQLEEDDAPSHGFHHRDHSPPGIDRSLTTDLGTLINLAGQLQQSLPPNYRWLGQGDLRVVGIRPIDAGGFADVWVGEMGNRKVAVKSYRCYASADHTATYNVSYPHRSCVSHSLAIDR